MLFSPSYSSIIMEGASSAKSNTQSESPSMSLETVPILAHKSKDASSASLIQDLQAQVHELQGRASEDANRIRTLEAQVHELKSSGFSKERRDAVMMPSRVCPAPLTEEVISALPMSLPAHDVKDTIALGACAAAYSDLNRRFSGSAVKAKDLLLALRQAWDISQKMLAVEGTGVSASASSGGSETSVVLATLEAPIQSSPDYIAQTENPPRTAEALKEAMQHIRTSVLDGTSSAADPPGFDECLMVIACGFLRRDENYLKKVFEKHSASPGAEAGLLKESMRAALKDAHFPLVSDSIATSDDELWGQVDLDSSGRVSFEEFSQFVRQRGSVENWMKTEQFLQILSDSVVPLLGADAGPDDADALPCSVGSRPSSTRDRCGSDWPEHAF